MSVEFLAAIMKIRPLRFLALGLAFFPCGAPLGLRAQDVTPPRLVSATSVDNNTVRVLFSEALQPASATNKANYAITSPSGALAVNAAVLLNTSNVTLATASQVAWQVYTLVVNGVRDASAQTNLIAANSTVTFTNRVFTVGYIQRQLYFDIGARKRKGQSDNFTKTLI